MLCTRLHFRALINFSSGFFHSLQMFFISAGLLFYPISISHAIAHGDTDVFPDALASLRLALFEAESLTQIFALMSLVHSKLMTNKSDPFTEMHQTYVSIFYSKAIQRLEGCPAFTQRKLIQLVRIMMEENVLMGIGFEEIVWNQFAIAYTNLLDHKDTFLDKRILDLLEGCTPFNETDSEQNTRTLWLYTCTLLNVNYD